MRSVPPGDSGWVRSAVVPAITLWGIGVFIATSRVVSLVTFLIGKKIMRVAHLRETLTLIAIGIGMALLGRIAARIHLFLFDPPFLRGGSLDKF
jgi:hypothetical protein